MTASLSDADILDRAADRLEKPERRPYVVEIPVAGSLFVKVEAASDEDAIKRAFDIIDNEGWGAPSVSEETYKRRHGSIHRSRTDALRETAKRLRGEQK